MVLWGAALISLLFLSGAFFAGYRIGLKGEGSKPRILAGAIGALLVIVSSGVGYALAANYGKLFMQIATSFGMSLSACFIAGYGAGNRKKNGRSPIGALTGILLFFAVTWILSIGVPIREIATGARQLGLDKTSATKPDAPNVGLDCKASLNEIYKGFEHYVEINDALPPADKWMDEDDFKGAVQADEWLHCPQVSNRKDASFGYAFNSSLAGKKLGGKKLSEMPGASKSPLAYDSTTLTKNAHDDFKSLPNPGRHNGMNSVLFCDGHIEELAPK